MLLGCRSAHAEMEWSLFRLESLLLIGCLASSPRAQDFSPGPITYATVPVRCHGIPLPWERSSSQISGHGNRRAWEALEKVPKHDQETVLCTVDAILAKPPEAARPAPGAGLG